MSSITSAVGPDTHVCGQHSIGQARQQSSVDAIGLGATCHNSHYYSTNKSRGRKESQLQVQVYGQIQSAWSSLCLQHACAHTPVVLGAAAAAAVAAANGVSAATAAAVNSCGCPESSVVLAVWTGGGGGVPRAMLLVPSSRPEGNIFIQSYIYTVH